MDCCICGEPIEVGYSYREVISVERRDDGWAGGWPDTLSAHHRCLGAHADQWRGGVTQGGIPEGVTREQWAEEVEAAARDMRDFFRRMFEETRGELHEAGGRASL
jgi:hypothetical protein